MDAYASYFFYAQNSFRASSMTFGHKKIPSFHSGFLLVARLGLEPRLTVPKTAVLPIRRSGILP